jgi:transposase InsO family protein
MAAHRTKCAKTSVLQRSAPLTRRVMGQDPHHLVDELFRRPPKEPRRKGINTIYTARRPNQIQQADLLYLPEDDGYKYLLVVVDLFDRHVEVEPLKNKDAQTVKDAFIEIYNNTDLKHPKQLQVDSGKEFMGVFKTYMTKLGTKIRYGIPGRHKMQALAENVNGIIGKEIFKRQIARELETGKVNKEWLDDIDDIVDHINAKFQASNNERRAAQSRIIGALSSRAGPGLGRPTKFEQNILPIGTKVRIKLDEPQDIFGKKLPGKFRAGDIRWSKKIYTITDFILKPGMSVHYLVDGIDNASFSRYELTETAL